MRKVFLFMMVSVDGYFEGLDHDLSWHNVDAEFNDFAVKQLDEVDTLLFGRRTYELMASFWPTEQSKKDDPAVARRMNQLNKFVFSTKALKVSWEHTQLRDDVNVIKDLKKRPGKAIAVLGSSNLCVSLLKQGLLDELRLMVAPVIVGQGGQLFDGLTEKLDLTLADERRFHSGNVLLTYHLRPEP